MTKCRTHPQHHTTHSCRVCKDDYCQECGHVAPGFCKRCGVKILTVILIILVVSAGVVLIGIL